MKFKFVILPELLIAKVARKVGWKWIWSPLFGATFSMYIFTFLILGPIHVNKKVSFVHSFIAVIIIGNGWCIGFYDMVAVNMSINVMVIGIVGFQLQIKFWQRWWPRRLIDDISDLKYKHFFFQNKKNVFETKMNDCNQKIKACYKYFHSDYTFLPNITSNYWYVISLEWG